MDAHAILLLQGHSHLYSDLVLESVDEGNLLSFTLSCLGSDCGERVAGIVLRCTHKTNTDKEDRSPLPPLVLSELSSAPDKGQHRKQFPRHHSPDFGDGASRHHTQVQWEQRFLSLRNVSLAIQTESACRVSICIGPAFSFHPENPSLSHSASHSSVFILVMA